MAPCYSTLNMAAQYFSLPGPVIEYIRTHGSPDLVDKLNKTCKYFFYVKRVVVGNTLRWSPYSNQFELSRGRRSFRIPTPYPFKLMTRYNFTIDNNAYEHLAEIISNVVQCGYLILDAWNWKFLMITSSFYLNLVGLKRSHTGAVQLPFLWIRCFPYFQMSQPWNTSK